MRKRRMKKWRVVDLRIAIINYGVGNLFSIYNGMKKVGGNPEIVAAVNERESLERIERADGVIIPGVGAYDDGIRGLKPIAEKLREIAESGVPTLGICVGMQIFFEWSEEGKEEGLGWIQGGVFKLPTTVRVPHMGWNNLKLHKYSELLDGISENDYFYFVHSYYCAPQNENIVAAFTEYGVRFAAVVSVDNLHGVQFHPEKSSKTGLLILQNFVHLCRR